MGKWKVSKEKIEILPHHNADSLDICKVASYQVVVRKGIHKTGDDVLFIPEKSLLTGILEAEWKKWLVGPDHKRVHHAVMRGEMSEGIIVPNELVLKITGKDISTFPYGEDLSAEFGITKYVPVVPPGLEGEVVPIEVDDCKVSHDVEQFGVYSPEFMIGEHVVLSEKINGSQGVYYMKIEPDGQLTKWASSKGLAEQGLSLIDDGKNGYWMGANKIELWDAIRKNYTKPWKETVVVQVFGEVIPVQGGNWTYGKHSTTLLIYKVVVNGRMIPHDMVPDDFRKNWVPIVYDGPFEDITKFRKMANMNEKVSGSELHISEGLVMTPYEERRAKDGTRLSVKLLNPDYKETGEEFN